MTQKVQTRAQLKNCEFSEEVQHSVHVLCRTHAQYDVAYIEMAWTEHFCHHFQYALAPITE